MWYVFALIGTVSMVAVIIYNHFIKAADADPDHPLNTRGAVWVKGFLIPICLILVAATIRHPSLGLGLNALFFCLMLVVSLWRSKPADAG